MPHIYIGTASWNIPPIYRSNFPEAKSILKRYSQVFNTVEINSSFYRNHKVSTYQRWFDATPENFSFVTKFPKQLTHQQHLKVTSTLEVAEVVQSMLGLRHKLKGILVQLPPKLEFNPKVAKLFFSLLRQYYTQEVFLEPRHLSWTGEEAIELMAQFNLTKVNADPAPCPLVIETKINYYRLHGSPEIYKSPYTWSELEELARVLRQRNHDAWVIFDNTQYGYATENALILKKFLAQESFKNLPSLPDAGLLAASLK